ncbi:exodeoxyribonuclease VII large subunit [Parashewanella spongiae]|uniref:Exodeoxyribonuclease 7 large subunit n=1 Tax=Parashewanella spongiae TaxID=342950 RepID=A0A3A6TJE7_9GAMM|nr:exodeoxyribonuclease VII large subunit [Parashewanella spongiae]MCL1079520.1 exodeoxyribonuclease VII large subunit [Parashewanella spongiae]RJY07446.1 exodeoxyribonuclease VII large subunit [Parashewanella spongiae]
MTKTIYTVSRLNGEVRRILEGEIGRVWLSAEVSNFSAPNSGHWYLTLKDHFSQIRCAMFKGKNRSVNFQPSNGQQVLVKGNISVYEPRGDYQLLIESMQPAGDGLLAQQFEALKMKLAADGLFAADSKRAIPKVIQRIGVVTSATGAAVRDILHVLQRRDPSIEVIIYPAQVQGDSAATQLCDAIDVANQRNEVDVILLTRGGGSMEDLWCFNDEGLAHTIYNSGLPIVSAVGHEVDTTISDYVADIRAPTPSAGAELLSKDVSNKVQQLSSLKSRLIQSYKLHTLQQAGILSEFSHRLQRHEPQNKLQQWQQRFDEIQLKLNSAINQKFHHDILKQQQLKNRLNEQSPHHRVKLLSEKLNYLDCKLSDSIKAKLKQSQLKLQQAGHQLNAISPLATLSRGYSITSDNNGCVITEAASLKQGDELMTRLHTGTVISSVEQILHEDYYQ